MSVGFAPVVFFILFILLAFPVLFTSSFLWVLFSVLIYWYLISCLIIWIWDWKRSKQRFNWTKFGKIFLIVIIIMIIVVLIGFVLSPPVYTGPYAA